MRIGLPRALYYYYYAPLWKKLFRELGAELVLSDPTHKAQVEGGIKLTVPEICVPIKIFNGHVLDLLEKGVDRIFLPRLIRVESDFWFCPKFLGLPELVRYTIPGAAERILSVEIESKREDTCEFKIYKPLCQTLGVEERRLKTALAEASAHWARFREFSRRGCLFDEAEALAEGGQPLPEHPRPDAPAIRLGVLGYVYNLYDPFASLEMLRRLRSMGVEVLTFEMLQEDVMKSHRAAGRKDFYWTFTDKLAGMAGHLMDRQDIDGLIHITAFGCGPDSVINKILELDGEQCGKPLMTLRIDEHTGESHLQTRLEAFVDMIARKKASEREGSA